MSRYKGPNPSLWIEGGGMVTRCDDPVIARPFLLEEYAEQEGFDLDDAADAESLADVFPIDKAEVQRGRVEPRDPDTNDGYSWIWRPLPSDRSGRGITTAVVWMDNR